MVDKRAGPRFSPAGYDWRYAQNTATEPLHRHGGGTVSLTRHSSATNHLNMLTWEDRGATLRLSECAMNGWFLRQPVVATANHESRRLNQCTCNDTHCASAKCTHSTVYCSTVATPSHSQLGSTRDALPLLCELVRLLLVQQIHTFCSNSLVRDAVHLTGYINGLAGSL